MSALNRRGRRQRAALRLAAAAALWLILSAIPLLASPVLAASNCGFSLGFQALHDAGPAIVGECLDNPSYAADGALQHTTRGLLVWKKAANRASFTDGYATWILGDWWIDRLDDPGLKVKLLKRRNDQRFSWESDSTGSGEQLVTWASCPSLRHPNLIDGSWIWCTAGPTPSPPTTALI